MVVAVAVTVAGGVVVAAVAVKAVAVTVAAAVVVAALSLL